MFKRKNKLCKNDICLIRQILIKDKIILELRINSLKNLLNDINCPKHTYKKLYDSISKIELYEYLIGVIDSILY